MIMLTVVGALVLGALVGGIIGIAGLFLEWIVSFF